MYIDIWTPLDQRRPCGRRFESIDSGNNRYGPFVLVDLDEGQEEIDLFSLKRGAEKAPLAAQVCLFFWQSI